MDHEQAYAREDQHGQARQGAGEKIATQIEHRSVSSIPIAPRM
jgi:hypothetical protein